MRSLAIGLFDLLLLLLVFFTVHVFKYGTLAVGERHNAFIFFILLLWLVLSLGMKKFSNLNRLSLEEGLNAIAITAVMMVGFISLIIVMLGLTNMSRMLVYGTIFIYAGIELIAFVAYSAISKRNSITFQGAPVLSKPFWSNPSISLAVADALLVFAAFVLATYLKRGAVAWTNNNIDILFLFFGAWLLTALILRKFEKENFYSLYNLVALSIKSVVFMAAGLAFIIYGLHFYYLSRGQIFGALVLFAVFELGLFYLYHSYKRYAAAQPELAFPDQARSNDYQHRLPSLEEKEAPCGESIDLKIRHALHFLEPALYDFLRDAVDLSVIALARSALVFTDKLFNISILEDGKHQLIVNLHKINDMRFLNQYFLMAHAKLSTSGYLVGKAHTLETHRNLFFSQFSQQSLGRVLFAVDFAWNRVFPKLPYAQKFYFAMTKGRNRLISKAEILGRLHFCGFRPIAEAVISDRFYFIAQKIMTPADDLTPTYGPLVELTRFGRLDKPITVYKFRTMHPYSEYLQEYVYQNNRLEKGGKFKDDFRVTGWGAFMRRWWIDELPMLYNWLRGDLQLVGVRPLSRQYLELYSPELRELRKQVKPGLLPPFYADMPTTLEEIMASERKYIESYLKAPLKTQLRYFFKCGYNIIAKKARSK